MREFLRVSHVRAAAGFDLVHARAGACGRFREALPQHLQGARRDREVQVLLVLEVHVDQRPAEPRAAGDAVHRDCVPPELAVQVFGGLHDFYAAAVLLFLAAFSDVRHGAAAYACVDTVSTDKSLSRSHFYLAGEQEAQALVIQDRTFRGDALERRAFLKCLTFRVFPHVHEDEALGRLAGVDVDVQVQLRQRLAARCQVRRRRQNLVLRGLALRPGAGSWRARPRVPRSAAPSVGPPGRCLQRIDGGPRRRRCRVRRCPLRRPASAPTDLTAHPAMDCRAACGSHSRVAALAFLRAHRWLLACSQLSSPARSIVASPSRMSTTSSTPRFTTSNAATATAHHGLFAATLR